MGLELQSFLFGREPTRRELLNYKAKTQKACYRVQVFRNHSFELIADTIQAYLDYARLSIAFTYSDYDDSFSFLNFDKTADLALLWIDTTRYSSIDVGDFLCERIVQLKSQFQKPILVISFGQTLSITKAGVVVWDLTQISNELGSRYIDEKAKEFTGTLLSRHAMLLISKYLGLRYLPALLKPRLKAVVVDLDNTLYVGVLGEDGAENLKLTDAHRRLQEKLKVLAQKGILLCVASKNDITDVEDLFVKREDFPLKKQDFSWICASWEPKTRMLSEILDRLNIGSDSVLFIDDNIGELELIHVAYPQLLRIHAKEDAAETCEVLDWFPGLYQIGTAVEDAIRKEDIWANQQRKELAVSMSAEAYIRSLKLQLIFSLDDVTQLTRISELAQKTNQFIFNYKRYTPAEVEKMLKDSNYKVVTVSLSDRLSDSGMIGVCVGKDCGNYAEIEECFISCRALGRGIDDAIVCGAIQSITETLGKSKVKIRFQIGPRNEPARRFVQERLASYLDKPQEFSYQMPENLFGWKFMRG